MARVFFGPRVPASWTERWVLASRVFLFTVIPWAFGTVFFSDAWWLSLLLLTVMIVIQWFLEIRMLEET